MAAEKCLERLGITLPALYQEPGYFLNRVHAGDRAKFARRLRDCALETELNVLLYDENSRARRDRVHLGTFLEYVDEETTSLRVGLVVACLKSKAATAGTQPQDLLLIIELPGESGETAKMPPSDALSRIIPTSAITCKIDVEQKPSGVTPYYAPPAPQQQQQQQPQQYHQDEEPAFLPPLQHSAAAAAQPVSAILQTLAERNGAFLCALGASFYGLDPEGTLPIGSYLSPLLSVASSNTTARGTEIFATTESGKLLSVELDQGRVRELGPTQLAGQVVAVRGLCFAEGKPAAFVTSGGAALPPAHSMGANQLFGIAKDVPGKNGDCLVMVHALAGGRCDLVFELGRRDITALACVPISLDFTRERNAWYGIGPSDADSRVMRFVLWTERGGLFVVDETRRSLQQLGGELVQSLEISAICFDAYGELFAAGSKALYSVSPAGRVVEVAPLQHLPGRVAGICYVPRTLLHPSSQPSQPQEEEEEQEDSRVEDQPAPRRKSWWPLGNNAGGGLLNLFRPHKAKAQAPAVAVAEPGGKRTSAKPRAPAAPATAAANNNYQTASFSGRRMSNPSALPPPHATFLPAETNSIMGGGEAAAAANRSYVQQQQQQPPPQYYAQDFNTSSSFMSPPQPPQQAPRRSQQQLQHTGPYFPPGAGGSGVRTSFPAPTPPVVAPPASLPPPNAARAPSSAPPPNAARAQRPNSLPPSSSVATTTTRQQVAARPQDVPALLHSLGLTQYVADFRREELVDINLLISMYASDREFKDMLKDVGVSKLGHREMIAHAIRQYV